VLDADEHGVGEHGRELLQGTVFGRGDDGRLHPGARHLEIVQTQGGVDGEHLLVPEPADGARLGGAPAHGGEHHLPVEDAPGGRIGEVLGCGPHRRPLCRRLHGHDAGGQTAAAVKESTGGGHGGGDGQTPAQGIVGGLEPEKVTCVHENAP